MRTNKNFANSTGVKKSCHFFFNVNSITPLNLHYHEKNVHLQQEINRLSGDVYLKIFKRNYWKVFHPLFYCLIKLLIPI